MTPTPRPMMIAPELAQKWAGRHPGDNGLPIKSSTIEVVHTHMALPPRPAARPAVALPARAKKAKLDVDDEKRLADLEKRLADLEDDQDDDGDDEDQDDEDAASKALGRVDPAIAAQARAHGVTVDAWQATYAANRKRDRAAAAEAALTESPAAQRARKAERIAQRTGLSPEAVACGLANGIPLPKK